MKFPKLSKDQWVLVALILADIAIALTSTVCLFFSAWAKACGHWVEMPFDVMAWTLFLLGIVSAIATAFHFLGVIE